MRERFGILPRSGGWMEQPLALLVKMEAIDLLVKTRQYMAAEGADWTKLSKTQVALNKWVDEALQIEVEDG